MERIPPKIIPSYFEIAKPAGEYNYQPALSNQHQIQLTSPQELPPTVLNVSIGNKTPI
jgi:hypothetical protein